jgi:hypothetical protein
VNPHNNRQDAGHAKVNKPHWQRLPLMAAGKKHDHGNAWKQNSKE